MSALPIGRECGGTPRRGVGREKEAGQGGGASVDEKGVLSEPDRVVGEGAKRELKLRVDTLNKESCWRGSKEWRGDGARSRQGWRAAN